MSGFPGGNLWRTKSVVESSVAVALVAFDDAFLVLQAADEPLFRGYENIRQGADWVLGG
jgi:hypothetical protein